VGVVPFVLSVCPSARSRDPPTLLARPLQRRHFFQEQQISPFTDAFGTCARADYARGPSCTFRLALAYFYIIRLALSEPVPLLALRRGRGGISEERSMFQRNP